MEGLVTTYAILLKDAKVLMPEVRNVWLSRLSVMYAYVFHDGSSES